MGLPRYFSSTNVMQDTNLRGRGDRQGEGVNRVATPQHERYVITAGTADGQGENHQANAVGSNIGALGMTSHTRTHASHTIGLPLVLLLEASDLETAARRPFPVPEPNDRSRFPRLSPRATPVAPRRSVEGRPEPGAHMCSTAGASTSLRSPPQMAAVPAPEPQDTLNPHLMTVPGSSGT